MRQSISGMRVCVLCTACSDRNIEKTVGHTGIARLCLTRWCHRTRTDGSLLRKEAPASIGGGGCHTGNKDYYSWPHSNRKLHKPRWSKSIHNRCRCRRSGICRKQSICGTGSRSCLFSTANRFSSKRNLSPAVNFHKPKWKLPESASRHTTASDRKLPGSTGEWRIHELRKFCKFPELWICTNIQQSNRLHEPAASWQQYAAG